MTDTLAARVEAQARYLGEMMQRLGVDPARAAREASGAALAAAARRCRACPEGKACARWLEENAGPQLATPAFCPNRAFFTR